MHFFNPRIGIAGFRFNLKQHFRILNSLCQHPVCGSAYDDMCGYPEYVIKCINVIEEQEEKYDDEKEDGMQLTEKTRSKINLINNVLKNIRLGAEVRPYGTLETLEEVTGRFSEFRGGCQVALMALECLPYSFLNNLDPESKWNGFVTTGVPGFSQGADVINVSPASVFQILDWFGLCHEIGHLLQEYLLLGGKKVNKNNPVIWQFLAEKPSDSETWYNLIVECMAEVLGFEIGFYNQWHPFHHLYWKRLKDMEPLSEYTTHKREFMMQSFFVRLFVSCFRGVKDAGITTDKVIWKTENNHESLYLDLLNHMKSIEELKETPKKDGKDSSTKKLSPESKMLAAEFAISFKKLYNFAETLSKGIDDLFTDRDNESSVIWSDRAQVQLEDENTTNVMSALENGTIWWGGVRYPEAILFNFIKKAVDESAKDKKNTKPVEVSLEKRLATIVTFWNKHRMDLHYNNN